MPQPRLLALSKSSPSSHAQRAAANRCRRGGCASSFSAAPSSSLSAMQRTRNRGAGLLRPRPYSDACVFNSRLQPLHLTATPVPTTTTPVVLVNNASARREFVTTTRGAPGSNATMMPNMRPYVPLEHQLLAARPWIRRKWWDSNTARPLTPLSYVHRVYSSTKSPASASAAAARFDDDNDGVNEEYHEDSLLGIMSREDEGGDGEWSSSGSNSSSSQLDQLIDDEDVRRFAASSLSSIMLDEEEEKGNAAYMMTEGGGRGGGGGGATARNRKSGALPLDPLWFEVDDEDIRSFARRSSPSTDILGDDMAQRWMGELDELLPDDDEDEDDEMAAQGLQRQRPAQKAHLRELLSQQIFTPAYLDAQSDDVSSLHDLQLQLECQSYAESAYKLLEMQKGAVERNDVASSLPPIRRLLLDWYEPLREAIEEEQRAYVSGTKTGRGKAKLLPYLCLLPAETLAILTMHEVVTSTLATGAGKQDMYHRVSHHRRGRGGEINVLSLCRKIGDAIEAEVNVRKVLRSRAERERRWKKALRLEEEEEEKKKQQKQGEAEKTATNHDEESELIDESELARRVGESNAAALMRDEERLDDEKERLILQEESREQASERVKSKSTGLVDAFRYTATHLRRFLDEMASPARPNASAGKVRPAIINRRCKRIIDAEQNTAGGKPTEESSLHDEMNRGDGTVDGEWTEVTKIKLAAALIELLLRTATVDPSRLADDRRQGHRRRRGQANDDDDDESEPAFRFDLRVTSKSRTVGFICAHPDMYRLVTESGTIGGSSSMEDGIEGGGEGGGDDLAAVLGCFAVDRYQPMVVPPREWTGWAEGGYAALPTQLMRTHGCRMQKNALRNADLSTVFDGLNVLGRIPWVINRTVLSVAQQCWEKGIVLGDIPSRTDHDVPDPPTRPDSDKELDQMEEAEAKEFLEEYRQYREAMTKYRRILQKNADLHSLRCSALLKFNQAEKFKNFDRIYFPYNMDFRGRTYPVTPHLSNVGSDMSRGLLRFAEAKPLGQKGLYWLKVHLANLAGADKMSFDGRAAFTESHMDDVRAAVLDPLGDNRWWMALDDPFQGLATCHEIVNAIDSGDPASYPCCLPVHVDGSCNGLQHYAALGRDRVGGKAVNLCHADKPQDVYIGVMEEVIRRVAQEAAVNLDFDESKQGITKEEKDALKRNTAAKLVDGLIDRGVVKRTVMTSVYGVTFIGARNQIQEKIEEKLEERGHDIDEIEPQVHAACGYLASLTMEVMGELFTGARQTMNWLADCARLITQQGQPVAWRSPIGVPVVQPYRQKKRFEVVTLLQTVILTNVSDSLPLHKSRQVTAFPPNYVHSLDSSHMLLTALEMDKRGLTFAAVHDSFWTHACDIDEMNDVLRGCFVDLYDQPLLENLKKSWELRYPSIDFPDVPQRGDLDLKEVMYSPYFFQ